MKAIGRTVDARRAAAGAATRAGHAADEGDAPDGEVLGSVAAPVPGAVALDDAAGRLPELVHAVEHGDEVTLTRDGRPVARIVAVAGVARRTSGRGAAAGATVAANVSTTAIQLTPPGEPGAPGAPGTPPAGGEPGATGAFDALAAPLGVPAEAPGDGRHAAPETAAVPVEPVGSPAAPAEAVGTATEAVEASGPPARPEPEPEPTVPTRVSTRPAAEPEPPAATDATIVLDPVPADDEPAAPPRRRSRRDLAGPADPAGPTAP
ncbi:type II toxin-antitoxin system prevent-host-death family antitoxin [Cellulomonas sp.]|uniref:type II toxin-antitoxin system Phd/YefM family antitoxin n=1 Tax=Cellulomonas sp. TaxID=40001 RepID=UPI002D5347A7|nr:type II toxin-antitoxin system prevent-host-death family antitoxin [Cellulomonas sp.]HYQ74200.1 type II toxin-antitoxin system prevent-host-death family antitoxin [Cellulomonas sp.]